MRSSLRLLPLLLALAPTTFGQGDDCQTATPISGLGTHTFNNFTNGTSTFSGCSEMGRDVFYQWTATAPGNFRVTTQGSNFDILLGAFLGQGCAAQYVSCDTAPGSLVVANLWNVAAGDTYLFQLGGYFGAFGSGVLNIVDHPCDVMTDDAFEPNDSCGAAWPLAPGFYPGLFASGGRTDHFEILVPAYARLRATAIVTTLNQPAPVTRISNANGCQVLATGHFSGRVNYLNSSPNPMSLVVEIEPTFCLDYNLRLEVIDDACTGTNYVVDAFEPNDDCVTAPIVQPGYYPDLWTTKLHASNLDDDWFRVQVPARQRVTVRAVSADDVLLDPYFRSCADVSLFFGDEIEYVNAGPGMAHISFKVLANNTNNRPCARYDLDVVLEPMFGGGVTGFCLPPNRNSLGRATALTGEIGAFPGAGLQLRAVNGPRFAPGYFLVAPQFSGTGVAVSDGRLCLMGSSTGYGIGRYNVAGTPLYSVGMFNFQGLFRTPDANGLLLKEAFDVPSALPLGGAIQPGETWNFQLWHRDGPGASNFSNGVSVTF